MPDGLPWWRRLRRRFYWLLAWKVLVLARLLPLAWGRAMGVGLARIAAAARPRERAAAEANLRLALPGLAAAGRAEMWRSAVDHLGANLFHALAARRLVGRPGFVVEEAPPGSGRIGETLDALAARGRGVFVLTGHVGCWELAGAWVSGQLQARGLAPLGVVTGTVHNPPVDRLLQGHRRSLGLVPLPRDGGAAPLLRFLRAGGVVAVLQDQHTRTRNRAIPFFGHAAPTPVGMARLAVRHGIPVLPVAGVWDARGGVLVMRSLDVIEPEGTGEAAEDALLARGNAALEEFIRRNPEQWVWFHRRWPDTAFEKGNERST